MEVAVVCLPIDDLEAIDPKGQQFFHTVLPARVDPRLARFLGRSLHEVELRPIDLNAPDQRAIKELVPLNR